MCIISIITYGMFVTIDRFNDPNNPARYITAFLSVILSIISFALSMTKPDVYKLMIDFLSFQHCKCGLCSSCWHKISFCCKSSHLQQHHQQQQQEVDETNETEDDMIVEEELYGLHFDHYLRTDRSIHRISSNCDNENNNIKINDNINSTSSKSDEKSTKEASIVIADKEVDKSEMIPKFVEIVDV